MAKAGKDEKLYSQKDIADRVGTSKQCYILNRC